MFGGRRLVFNRCLRRLRGRVTGEPGGAADEDLIRVHRLWQGPQRPRDVGRQAGALPKLQGGCGDSAGTPDERTRNANGARRARTATVLSGCRDREGVGTATGTIGGEAAADGCGARGGRSSGASGASFGRGAAERGQLNHAGCAPHPYGRPSVGRRTAPRLPTPRAERAIATWRTARLAREISLLAVWGGVCSFGDFAVGERRRGDR